MAIGLRNPQWLAPLIGLGVALACWSTLASPPAPHSVASLQAFTAVYTAYFQGKLAGNAQMHLWQPKPQTALWQIDMAVHGRHGFASLLGLNLVQTTQFWDTAPRYIPLQQTTCRTLWLFERCATGHYDWQTRVVRWDGPPIPAKHRAAMALQPGDQTALLINLALMRDASPDRTLTYRYVETGRVREYIYHVATHPETIEVNGLRYTAIRIARTNGGTSETFFWIANGVPTPIRILQREHGQDRIDLQLVNYQGV